MPDYVEAAFAARHIDTDTAAELFRTARHTLDTDTLKGVVTTFTATRLLSWPECLHYAHLLQPTPTWTPLH